MNKKDIALSVGGVVATMVLAYLLYRLQQRDAAAAAAAAQQSAADAAITEQDNVAYQADPYNAAISALSGSPSLTGTVTNTSPAVASSGVTADTGSNGTGLDQNDTSFDNLFAGIMQTFGGAITAQASTPESVASMTIPQFTGLSSNVLNNIPVTAAEAAAPAAPGISYDASNVPAEMFTGYAVSSHPVTAHPILGSQVSA